MNNTTKYLPQLVAEEQYMIGAMIEHLNEEEARIFALRYSSLRKSPQTIMLLTILGFVGFAGIQRFVLEEIPMGLLYFFTGGLCYVGTIIDLMNYQNLALEYNREKAQMILQTMKY